MSFFDIFNPSTTNKVIDNVSAGLDKAFFTEEEKSDVRMKILDTKLKMAQSNGNFQLAQRYLSFLFAINFIISFWGGVLILIFNKPFINDYLKLIATFSLGWIMLAIISFYFGGGFINSFKQKDGK